MSEEMVGVVSLSDLLRDLILIKKYAMESGDERIYLCADNIEQQLNNLSYGGFILSQEWWDSMGIYCNEKGLITVMDRWKRWGDIVMNVAIFVIFVYAIVLIPIFVLGLLLENGVL